jgi:hypothetical protein
MLQTIQRLATMNSNEINGLAKQHEGWKASGKHQRRVAKPTGIAVPPTAER